MKRHFHNFTISFWSHSVFKQKTALRLKKRFLPENQRVAKSWRGRRKLFYVRIIICIHFSLGSRYLRWANYHRFTIDLPQIHRNIYIYSVCPPQLGTASCVTNSKRVASKDRVDGRSYYNMMMILSFWISFGHEFLTKNQNIQNIVFFTLTLAWLQDMHIITQSCTFICERDFCHMYDRQFFIFVDLYRCFLQDRRWRKLPGFRGIQILALSWFWYFYLCF